MSIIGNKESKMNLNEQKTEYFSFQKSTTQILKNAFLHKDVIAKTNSIHNISIDPGHLISRGFFFRK